MTKLNEQSVLDRCLAAGRWRAFDISAPIFEGMPSYPGDPLLKIAGPYSVLPDGTTEEYCYKLTMTTQTGTHIQGPHYFLRDGRKISDYEVSAFRMVAHVIDLRADHDFIHSIGRLADQQNLEGRAIVVRTGFMDRLIQAVRSPNYRQKEFTKLIQDRPFLPPTAVERLVECKVGLVGIDSLGLEPPDSTDFAQNTLLCRHGVLILEGLAGLGALPGKTFLLEAFPLRIDGVEGTPCRAVASYPLDDSADDTDVA